MAEVISVVTMVLLFHKIEDLEGSSGLRKRKNNFTLAMLPLRYRRELNRDGGETVESSGLGWDQGGTWGWRVEA